MDLEVIWSKFAEKQLDKIFEYYEENASERVAIEMIEGLLNEPDRLKRNPFIGQKELLLQERKISYRYLVFKNYKIIYSVEEENGFIKIADVFGTKQKPSKIERFDWQPVANIGSSQITGLAGKSVILETNYGNN